MSHDAARSAPALKSAASATVISNFAMSKIAKLQLSHLDPVITIHGAKAEAPARQAEGRTSERDMPRDGRCAAQGEPGTPVA